MQDQDELQATHRLLELKHIVVLVHFESHAEMKNIIDVLGLDMLLTYDQDALHHLAFVARESLLNWSQRVILSVEH